MPRQDEVQSVLNSLSFTERMVALVNCARERDAAPLVAAAGLLTIIATLAEQMELGDRQRLILLLDEVRDDLCGRNQRSH